MWLQDGSTAEDDPVCRASNHFHNPLQPFSTAGVTDLPLGVRLRCAFGAYSQVQSNATWGTRYTAPTEKGSATGNDGDWDAARTAYYLSWTKANKVDRDAKLAETFLKLGQVLHLIQDLAVPAHVRNDFRSHLQYCEPSSIDLTRWCTNSFEQFVRQNPALVDATGGFPVAFTEEPVVSYWDRDAYRRTNPSSGWGQGLAEYTNANFASQHTVFTEAVDPESRYAFPYPRESSTNLPELLTQRLVAREVTAEDGVVDLGLYLSKQADGELIFPFLKTGYLTDYLMTILTLRPHLRLSFQADDAVHAAYADKLLPRAISYSAGLLDYFFRGRLDFELKAGAGQDGQVALTITNKSPEAMDGTFALYAEDATENRGEHPEVLVFQSVPSGATSAVMSFTPARRATKYVLAFQGRLGAEEGAVAGIVKPYDPPPAIPIQRSARLIGEEQHWSGTTDDGWSIFSGESRYRSGRQQQAQGDFAPAYLGQFLRRIDLTFDAPPDPAKNEVMLSINGTNVGTSWSRDTYPGMEPQTWSVVLNLEDEARMPRFIVAEAESGERIATPFVWWKSAWTYGTRGVSRWVCDVFHCVVEDSVQWRVAAEVGFGDGQNWYDGAFSLSNPHTAVGFIPLTGIAGYPVGSYEETADPSYSWCAHPGESKVERSVRVFAAGSSWQKNHADVLVKEGQGALKEIGACYPLETPSAETAPPLPVLQFQRDYKDWERARFYQFGIETPTAHVINLD